MNIIFIKLEKLFLPLLFVLFTICLVIFSKSNFSAALDGLNLFATSVIPSLFPFFVATELLTYTNLIPILGKLLNKIMRPVFNVPGQSAFAFIMGLLSGYPVGAKIVTKLRNDKICTKEEGERLLSFTNNSGPLFIISTIGISCFNDYITGVLLLITHILGSISVGIVFRFWKYKIKNKESSLLIKDKKNKDLNISNLGQILSTSIINSINTLLMIGGFIVLFSIIISILKNSKTLELLSTFLYPIKLLFNLDSNIFTSFISGLLEITNGIKNISFIGVKDISKSIILCAFLLGFGGISILLQVVSIISKSDLSIKPYILGKFLHGLFAAFYTFLLLNYSTFFII